MNPTPVRKTGPGKGDKRRPENLKKFNENYDRINWRRKTDGTVLICGCLVNGLGKAVIRCSEHCARAKNHMRRFNG